MPYNCKERLRCFQELAEVRDVLLEQIDIFQTQGRRHTMQHELQALISGSSSRLSPSQSLKLISSADSDQAQASPRSSAVFEPTVQQAETEPPVVAGQSQALYSSNEVGCEGAGAAEEILDEDEPSGQSTPTAGSDDDDDDSGSEGSSVRERFLEELEEMSQQSGQDLPLEWELTSTTVSHTTSSGGAGAFERDQTGSGSVWEVFDGRCLRRDCREVRHRYNYLFHWLSRVCSLPTKPTLQGEGSRASRGGDGLAGSCGGEEEGEEQGEGWVEAGAEELDSVILADLLKGKDAALETALSSHGSELDAEDRENIHLSEAELLSRLLSVETQRISLEQRLSSHLQLFNQEREELQLRGDALQTKCDELENINESLVKELAVLEHKCSVVQSEAKEEISAEVCCDPQEKSTSQENNDHLLTEETATLQEHYSSLQGKLNSLQEDNRLLTQQLSAAQETVSVQQEEKAELQQRGVLEEKCVFLEEEVKTLKRDNQTLQKDSDLQQSLKEEPTARCRALAEELEQAVSSNQEIVQKRDTLQAMCSSLEEQLADVQEDVPRLHSDNQNLMQEFNAKDRELQEKNGRLEDLEDQYKALEKSHKTLQENHELQQSQIDLQQERSAASKNFDTREVDSTLANKPKNSMLSPEDCKVLQGRVESLQDENRSLQEKMDILEESNKSLEDRCEAIQDRDTLLQDKIQSHDSKNEGLQAELQFVKENLQAAEKTNNSLLNKVSVLEASKGKDGSLQANNKSLHEKCAALVQENKALCEEVACLKDTERTLKGECQLLKGKCRALKDELHEATQSGQSLREQLHEQSMTLENVISEMRGEGSQELVTLDDGQTGRRQEFAEEGEGASHFAEGQLEETEEDLRCQLSKLEQVLSEKDDLVAELKEQMTMLSLQQAAIGSLPAQRETTGDLEQEAHDLREELIEKENVIQELQEQLKALKHRVREDSDLEQEVSILHQALFEKEKVIQELKETSRLLQLSHQDKSQTRSTSSRRGQMASTDRQERTLPEDEARRSQMRVSKSQDNSMEATSKRSVESTESLAVSSDQDSDIIPGQDVDLVKEMGRLRKDIKKTKAVYANESILFQEALDREHISQIGLRGSRSPSSSVDFSEMTQNDIPDDAERLKKIVVKLLEENKSLTTENLRLQLRIREQEELVVEMEERLPHSATPPENWQSLFERQLLLLQKQRDELLHQICERDCGVQLLSTRIGKAVTGAAGLHHQQEDLTAKMSELEHCHQLLQQRQAELAHCQAEKRHLEQLLLLKDETERQLMRQKRLLEEELATIEGKLQEREATVVEEKARLMKELKEKELHIFHLQTYQVGHPRGQSPGDPGDSQLHRALMGRPQSASTPRLSSRSLSSQAFFMQSPGSHQQELSVCPHPQDEGAEGGSFLDEPDLDPTSHRQPPAPESRSFPENVNRRPPPHDPGRLTGRRHSTGTSGPGRFPHAPVPKDPEEMYKFHREAVERLRDKLQLEMEAEMARLSEGQAAAITGYWQRHNKQVP